MKIIKITAITFGFLAISVLSLYLFFIYTPAIEEPILLGSFEQSTIDSGQHQRRYSWYKPSSFIKGSPVIFVLHGSMGSGEFIREQTAYEFDLLAEQYGFIVVYPDGYKRHWNDCRASADYAANQENIDDVNFLKDVIAIFIRDYQIDHDRVFATGHSNGGHMAYRLAFEAADIFSGVAPISANMPVNENNDCKQQSQPISLAVFNGTNDPVNPYDGGLVSIMGNTSRGGVLSSWNSITYWKNLAHINDEPSIENMPEVDSVQTTGVVKYRWLNERGIDIRLYELQGSGHVVPSKIKQYPRVMGGNAGDISGPEEIIKFFYGLRLKL